jgi:pimeloyl-ACP methyl ester carboxylesterase
VILRPASLFLLVIPGLSVLAQTNPPREHFDHATVQYDWVTNLRGEKLRTFITRPNQGSGRVPVIFFVGWLSCDSMEYPDANTKDGFGVFLRRLIDESGYATVRVDKPGVGESQGDCAKADFQNEMAGWQSAFDSMAKYTFMDLDRVFVVGLSNGGGFSAAVPRAITLCGASSRAGPGDAPGTSTCSNWSVAG